MTHTNAKLGYVQSAVFEKYISILLSVVMLFSIMIPTSAFAASTTSDLSAADMVDDNGTEYLLILKQINTYQFVI